MLYLLKISFSISSVIIPIIHCFPYYFSIIFIIVLNAFSNIFISIQIDSTSFAIRDFTFDIYSVIFKINIFCLQIDRIK